MPILSILIYDIIITNSLQFVNILRIFLLVFKKLKNIYENIKGLNSALDNYKKETVVQSLPIIASVNRAKKLMEDGKYEEAEIILSQALDIGEDALVYKYLGIIREQKGHYKQAAAYYAKSAEINPQDKEIWLKLGMSELYSENFQQAISSFEKANKITPRNTDVLTGWGMTLMRMKKYAEARDKFTSAAQISKYNYTAILLSAVMEMRLGEYSNAQDKLRFLVKVAPNETSNYEYAHLKLIKGEYDEAIYYAGKALELNKYMLPAYFITAEAYSILRNTNKTDENFEKALRNGLDNPMLHFEYGKANIRLFKFDAARKEFSAALEKEPEFLEAKIGIALLDAYDKRFSLLDELKEKNAASSYIQEACGLELINAEKYNDGISFFKKALKTDKTQIYNYYNLACAYKLLNNNTKTKEYFEKLTQNAPEYFQGFFDYSKWLTDIGEYAQAKRKLQKAEKLNPNNTEVLNLLFFVQYTLVKNNISEYNIKETLETAQRAEKLGNFEYTSLKRELENTLRNIQGNK